MATTNSLPLEDQDLRSNPPGIKDRLRNLWERSRASREPEIVQPQPNTFQTDSQQPIEKSSVTITAHDDFRVEARSAMGGWKITSIDQTSGLRHEFYVQDGVIFHISLYGEPGQFVVGRAVGRLSDSERQAILHAVEMGQA
jgi:hypothetical protein